MAIIRRSNLDITQLDIGGVDYLRRSEGVTAQLRATTAEAHGAAWRHQKKETVLREFVFTVPMFLYLSDFPRTNLDVSLFNVGTDQFLPDVETLSIDITTETDQGHGLNDFDAFPVPTGTVVAVTARVLNDVGGDMEGLMAAMRDGDPTDFEFVVSVAAGAATFAMPMTLANISHTSPRSAIQGFELTFEPNATFASGWGITNAFASVPLLASALTGTAFVPLEFTSSSGLSYAGEGLITRGSFNVQKRGLIRNEIEIMAQGPVGAVTP